MKIQTFILILIAATVFAGEKPHTSDEPDGYQTQADKEKTGPLFIVGGCKKKSGLTISNFRGTPSDKNPVGRYIPIGKQQPIPVAPVKEKPAVKQEDKTEDGLPLDVWRKCIIEATRQEPNDIKKRLACYQELKWQYNLQKAHQ
jgi:hypothetical protein